MAKLSEVVRSYIQAAGGTATSEQIKTHVEASFPDEWKPSTLQTHLYACAVNNPKAYLHHPSAPRYLLRTSDGAFEIYSEATHGPNCWEPRTGDGELDEVPGLVEASIGFERDLEDHLIEHLASIESGLTFKGRQVKTDVGRIDILAADRDGRRVVIEIKVGEAKDSAIGQIARYLGWYLKADGNAPRGILIAAEFSEGVQYAAAAVGNLRLVEYRVHFDFKKVEL